MKIVGRENEFAQLSEFYNSGRPEFIVVYGRRRIGKTVLLQEFFRNRFDFYSTGIIEGTPYEEKKAFYDSLVQKGYEGKMPKNWLDMFQALSAILSEKMSSKDRCVIFLDEISCFDTPNSGFVKALGHFWNSVCAWHDNVMLVICASATSWIVNKVLRNKGGLHARKTHEIHLRPFNLHQCEEYFKSRNSFWDRKAILQAYMVFGGVPYYLNFLDMGKSLAENIDMLFFGENHEMREEYQNLFRSIFRNPEKYMAVIKLLADKGQGMTRQEILHSLKMPSNSHATELLEDLVQCDFLRKYYNGKLKNSEIYQLVDLYVLFYHKFCIKPSTDKAFWRKGLHSSQQEAWYGLTFEKVCLLHVWEIIYALGLQVMRIEYYSWKKVGKMVGNKREQGAQIDLIIDRADGVIDICEMKYSDKMYTLDRAERDKIERRISAFSEEMQCEKAIQAVLVTTKGLSEGIYSSEFHGVVTMDQLFKDISN